jgi:quercetin dioxygenase-like cupin family protein
MKSALAVAIVLCAANVYAAQESGVIRKMADNKFVPQAGLPECVTVAPQQGDPAKGAFVILFKAKSGCAVPWHWHSANESVMIVAGSAKIATKSNEKSSGLALGPGAYAMLPAKHVHQFTCSSACTAFVTSDWAFDIHYIDESGKEIPPEAALAKKKK